MFTGIIQAFGKIQQIQPTGVDARFKIHTGHEFLEGVQLGDSIAVNGVCLTVTEMTGGSFWADVSGETLQRTTFAHLKVNDLTNLEKALTPQTHLGGHIVSGHVDGIGILNERYNDGRSVRLAIKAPDALAKYIAEKGSICVDGISLTVNLVKGAVFELNIVPHTLEKTTLGTMQTGHEVNLEVDIIARYLERLVLGDKAANPNASNITEAFLQQNGFA
ncbi:riboflavin synthase [Candidatus Albibeggiatoa sp. nov. NOAA]|uniref:riboflavin synthase n=1 Tax=Candidatus Albibeggiatoa sp. nov. NOAA TaxID=3162724 RepID=UPI003300C34D|nr:riboflavin synthase [Thiotrichaceae bacterium]